MVKLLNHYYDLDYATDLRMRDKVFEWLKSEKLEIRACFMEIQNNQLYKDAQAYRNAAAHGTSLGSVRNTVEVKKDDLAVSGMVGEYTDAQTIMENMERYASYTGEKIQTIFSLVVRSIE